MNPIHAQEILAAHQHALEAGAGGRTAIYKAAAERLGMSLATLYRKLESLTMKDKPRKRRSDAGSSAIPLRELQLISALLVESIRANNKQLSSIKLAVARLRSNGLIRAESVVNSTGEMKPMSESAISRALYQNNLHPSQLLAPAPAISLASKHPNHVWQIDASISTQFYLDDDGARTMSHAEYYDGKPENLKKIERKRLWRYVITDHTSGTIYVQYVLGAESAENICHVLICAMQKRGEQDPFHGVPFMLMTDPGAAMKSAMFRNLCQALGIELIINEVGNARAKGQVEQAHNIVEKEFESGLKLEKAESLEHINTRVGEWMRAYNATEIHSRHRRTRYGVWMLINPQQLRIAPPAEICREMATSAPQTRVVSPLMIVSFNSAEYDVSSVPGVMVGEKVLMTRNPWRDAESAQVIRHDDNGHQVLFVVERIGVDQFGFRDTSAMLGEEYKRHAETPAQVARKVLEQIATGTDTQDDAEKARKAKAVPFAGAIDPHKHLTDTSLPAYLPKRGTEVETTVTVATVEIKPMSHAAAAKALRARMGADWNAESLSWLKSNYPSGVLDSELDAIVQQLQAPVRPGLRIVGGTH
ncbi:transposase family protein [Pseudomonas nitroreducens]|uniref:DDE-type integrase/transposase/recombinase n=1 Tax=Pseudomonas nitroreducens TaxID=46680 RepID=UPI001472906A|nr:DDE-type integrase/transposase/recombinase [Pseudomonas nitroreducens]NMZ73425.1 transposase family protein [Pseudomonas nitroreducens]